MLRKQSAFVFATRTWVSGVGDDANPCSRTAPCKTFPGAISKTAAGGIINCLDPGGFGAVTITKSITIDCTGTFGGILAAGTNAINVNGAGVVVTLRGLDIEGEGTGLIGINVTASATVHVEQSRIYGFQAGGATGINFASAVTLIVKNTHLPSSGTGIVLNGANGANNMTLRDVISDQNASHGVSILSAGLHAGDHRPYHARLQWRRRPSAQRRRHNRNHRKLHGCGQQHGRVERGRHSEVLQNNQIGGNSVDGTPITHSRDLARRCCKG